MATDAATTRGATQGAWADRNGNAARNDDRGRGGAEGLARGLGWFSLALGALEVAAPRALDRWIGVGDHARLTRAYGGRELAAGAGILAAGDPTPWVWARVGGDALDIASLGAALRAPGARRGRVGAALAAVVGVTVLDVVCARRLGAR